MLAIVNGLFERSNFQLLFPPLQPVCRELRELCLPLNFTLVLERVGFCKHLNSDPGVKFANVVSYERPTCCDNRSAQTTFLTECFVIQLNNLKTLMLCEPFHDEWSNNTKSK